MKPTLCRRIVRKTSKIHGWFSPEAAYLFALLDEAQKEHGVTGNIFEIGVHQGKSTVVLGAMIDPPTEELRVCDIFSDQKLNTSSSGCGDLEIFLRNFSAFFREHDFLKIFQKPSSDLTVNEVTRNCRFFHIDGGHTADEVLSDIELAANSLIPGGIIAIDDAFNPAWPSVTEAVFTFLTKNSRFSPLVLGFNKLVLAQKSTRGIYSKYFADCHTCWEYIPREPYALKTFQLFRKNVYIFYIPTWKSARSVKSRLYELYFRYPWLRNRFTVGALRVLRKPLQKFRL